MTSKKLAPTRITEDQNKWLEFEKRRTGNGFAAIVRSLIQEQITKAGKK